MITKQVWKIGDCLELLHELQDNSIDLILTDPPYNLGVNYGPYVDDCRTDYKEWCKKWFDIAKRKAKSLIFTPGWNNLRMWLTEIEYPKGLAVWYCSNQCSHSNLGGFNHWEPILVYGKVNLSKNVFVQNISMQHDTGEHPCPKQTDLFLDILTSLNPKPLSVVDCFAGSGTTLKACRILDISAFGIEINPDYDKIIEKRLMAKTHSLETWADKEVVA